MKSVNCSMYILVFLEYSNSITGLPLASSPSGIVSSSRPARTGDCPAPDEALFERSECPMRMRGKTALVTGGGSGLGRATALRLAAEGARGACADLGLARAEGTGQDVKTAGGGAVAIEVDVTDAAACERMVAATLQRFGALTTLVNSAGVASTLGHPPSGAGGGPCG